MALEQNAIGYEQVKGSADELKKDADAMQDLIKQLADEMKSLPDVLQSRSADEFMRIYDQLNTKVEEMPNDVRNFADTAITAVNVYQEAEDKLNQNTGS